MSYVNNNIISINTDNTYKVNPVEKSSKSKNDKDSSFKSFYDKALKK